MNCYFERLACLIFLVTHLSCAASITVNQSEELLGTEEQLRIHSELLDQELELRVYLPEGYCQSESVAYPMIFFTEADRHMEFLATHLMGQISEASLPECILVGLPFVGMDDALHPELTHSKVLLMDDEAILGLFASQAKMLQVIEEELMPVVTSHYRIDGGNRVFFGQGHGAVLPLYAYLTRASCFDGYIFIDPYLDFKCAAILSFQTLCRDTFRSAYCRVFISEGEELQKKPSLFMLFEREMEDNAIPFRDRLVESRRYHVWGPGLTPDDSMTAGIRWVLEDLLPVVSEDLSLIQSYEAGAEMIPSPLRSKLRKGSLGMRRCR